MEEGGGGIPSSGCRSSSGSGNAQLFWAGSELWLKRGGNVVASDMGVSLDITWACLS